MRGGACAKASTCHDLVAPCQAKASGGATPNFIDELHCFNHAQIVATGDEGSLGRQPHAVPTDPTVTVRGQQGEAMRLQGKIENPFAEVPT